MGKLIAKESSPICWQTTIIVNNDYSKELLLFSTEGALDSEIQSNVSASKEANKAEQFWMYSFKQQSAWQAKSSKSIDSGIFQLPSIQLSDQSICLHLSTGSVFIFHSFQFPPLAWILTPQWDVEGSSWTATNRKETEVQLLNHLL